MGRPRDQFAWAQVEELENGTWKCIHCHKVHSGAASRIRNHLSGVGNGIAPCDKASEAIQNEALNQITRKRARGNTSPSSNATADPVVSIERRATEEFVTDAFTKLLMSYSCSSSPGPNFNDFLERTHKHGVPSSLLVNDSIAIRRSLLNLTQDVRQHTLMLKECWKTSGCTLMVFPRTFPSPVHNVGTCVVGFYCPKGIVFMEAPHPDTDYQGFRAAMEQHEPSLDLDDDATSYVILRHNVDSNGGSGNDWTRHVEKFHPCRCLRDEIQEICIDMCRKSIWAEGMIRNAVEIHEKLCCHEILRLGYHEIMEKDSESFTDFDNTKGMPAIRLSIFLSIMRLNFIGLRQKLLNYIERNSFGSKVEDDLEVIFIDSNHYDILEFWDEGRKLQLIFTFILKLLDLMDTLVPTSGILAMALDMVEYKLCGGDDPILKEGDESFTFWKKIEPKLRGTIEHNYMRNAAMYMNPLYCTRLRNTQGPQIQTKIEEALIKFVYGDVCGTEVERADLIRQVRCYDYVFIKVFDDDMTRYNDHPLKLWEEHGYELPLLRKHAITLLSQPLNCMCKQVKKHMYELNGADDYILRLNVRMMEEFKLLSDDFCSPIGVLFGDWLTN